MQGLSRKLTNMYFNQKKRARSKGQELRFTLDFFKRKGIAAISTACPCCGKTLTESNISCDHGQPVSRGGSFNDDNLCFMCLYCNLTKGSLTMYEYECLLSLLNQWHPEAKTNVLARLKAGAKIARC